MGSMSAPRTKRAYLSYTSGTYPLLVLTSRLLGIGSVQYYGHPFIARPRPATPHRPGGREGGREGLAAVFLVLVASPASQDTRPGRGRCGRYGIQKACQHTSRQCMAGKQHFLDQTRKYPPLPTSAGYLIKVWKRCISHGCQMYVHTYYYLHTKVLVLI